MANYIYTYTAAELQEHHDKVESGLPVENRFKGNQNWNVAGSTGHDLPSPILTTYPAGAEVAAGRFCVSSLVDATYELGLFNATSGSYYIEYDGDFTDNFYGVKLDDDSITQDGCTLALVSGKTRLTVDVGVVGAHKFAGLSEQVGVWDDIGDMESMKGYAVTLFEDESGIDNGVNIDWSSTGHTIEDFDLIILRGVTSNTVTGGGGNIFATFMSGKLLGYGRMAIGEACRSGGIEGYAYVGCEFNSITDLTARVVASGVTYTASFIGIYGIKL